VVGGAEVYLERLSEILASRAELFAVCSHPLVATRLRWAGVRVTQIPECFDRRVTRIAKYPLTFLVVIYLLLRYRIHTLHLNGYQTAFLAFPARVGGCLSVITPHHIPCAPFARGWYSAAARWVDYAISVSAVGDVQHRAVLPSVRSVIIRNWVPNLPCRLDLRAGEPKRQVIFVGRLVKDKGLPELIDAIRLLQGDVKLIVAGDGPMRQEWEALSQSLPIRFVGFSRDVSHLFSQADALIVPSRGAETSSLVAIEAMASGLPCIMSDIPAHREVAQDGSSALLYPVGNSSALASAISDVINDHTLARVLAATAHKMVKSHYSFETAQSANLKAFDVDDVAAGDGQLVLQ
jgi:glycosyltransferase involved in cell wall biosynthesis